MNEEARYTADEIYDMFINSDLNFEFKNEIGNRFIGMVQAMYNAVHKPESMVMVDTYGDAFQEAHNEVVTLYQKHT
jgi:hypothetical protein